MKKQLNPPAVGKKLTLNKKTISNLKASEMSNVVGGQGTLYYYCNPGPDSKGQNCHTNGNGNTCLGHNTCFTC